MASKSAQDPDAVLGYIDPVSLKVVLPMLTFVPGGMGGSETYAREVVAALSERTDIEVCVLVAPPAAGYFGGVREVVVDGITGGAGTVARLRSIAQAASPGATARAALREADVVHHMFTVPVPGQRGTPHLVTLLDVQHLDVPEMFSRAERAYRRFAYDQPARRSDRLITISSFSKDRIVERLSVAPDRIDVALLAVNPGSFVQPSQERETFAFYPAASWPHKNHDRLLAAMEIVRARRPDLRLVLTGAGREKLGGLPSWVEHRGHVPTDELRGLYGRAACLVFPSLYEGFGLPPLEAMAAGCPVAAARSGSLPEVCGDAAVFFDPHSPADIAAAIERVLVAGPGLVEAGLRQAARFTWDACAESHVSSYRSLARR